MTKKGAKQKGGRHTTHNVSNNKDVTERKRDERVQRNKLKKERRKKEFHGDYSDDDFVQFKRQLDCQGLKLREITGDGNCLFRSLADQLNGDDKLHMRHRKEVVEYMRNHQDDFAPFLDETVTFEKYLQHLASSGTYGGNDSVVAFARKNSVDVIIHQYDSPAFIVNGQDGGCQVKVHLAYHSMEHYSSVRIKDDPGDGPAHMFHRSKLLHKPHNTTTVENTKKKDTVIKQKLSERKKAVEKEDLNGKIEQIKSTTGYKDEEKIEEYLNENAQDLDATLSFIFQLMALSETSQEQLQSDIFSSENTREERLHNSRKKYCEDEELGNDIRNLLTKLVDLVVKAEDRGHGNSHTDINKYGDAVSQEEEEEEENECNYDDDKNTKQSNANIAKTRDDSSGKIPNSSGSKTPNNGGAKITNKQQKGATKHLSNRQRKEMLKQQRKKRREVNKKDPNTNTSSISSSSVKQTSCGDGREGGGGSTTPSDIHVISI